MYISMYVFIYIAAARHMVTTKPWRIVPYFQFFSCCGGFKSAKTRLASVPSQSVASGRLLDSWQLQVAKQQKDGTMEQFNAYKRPILTKIGKSTCGGCKSKKKGKSENSLAFRHGTAAGPK